jgi:hypothetical protein
VGSKKVVISKKYYKSATTSVLVPILKQKNVPAIHLTATGRQIPITLINKVTSMPVEGASIEAEGAQAKTDKKGQAVLVVPADSFKIPVTIKAPGYNTSTTDLALPNREIGNYDVSLTPAGKLYFLSNRSGKIDVVKTNLDGTERQLVLGGTGKEDKRNTVLLASRDWKYLALFSKRDGGEHAKLFLIETGTDQVTTMDEGNADFELIGWSGDRFIYKVNRVGYTSWQSGATALKSYAAAAKKITTLDQTAASGTNNNDYVTEQLSTVYALANNEIVYAKNIYNAYYAPVSGKQATLNSIKADGSAKHIIKAFPITPHESAYMELRPYGPNGIYLAAQFASPTQYFEYENGQFKATDEVNENNFYDPYPTYLQSPSGKLTFWSELRDGKNALFIGNEAGENGKQVASIGDYQTYGWFTDDYLLVSKNGSALSIMAIDGKSKPFEVTDYYKPDFSFRGYGGGYGGL